tara:strand:- start:6642 stop:7433 length:792 start_codon:yes stop_codon:yes gene_type:complete
MRKGYIKLYRNLTSNPTFEDPLTLQLFLWLLLNVNYEAKEYNFQGRVFPLKSGQLMTSRHAITKSLGLDRSKALSVYRKLKKLEKLKIVKMDSSKLGVLISILNWDKYQGNGETTKVNNIKNENEQHRVDRKNKKLTTSEQRKDNKTEQQTKNRILKINKKVIGCRKIFVNNLLSHSPKFKLPKSFDSWDIEFDRIHRLDKREIDEMVEVIEFCTKDDFWKTTILSPYKVRKHFDRLVLQKNKNRSKRPRFTKEKYIGGKIEL